MTNTATLNKSNNTDKCGKLKCILRTKQKTISVQTFATYEMSKVRPRERQTDRQRQTDRDRDRDTERDTETHRECITTVQVCPGFKSFYSKFPP